MGKKETRAKGKKGDENAPSPVVGPLLERIEAQPNVWCLVMRDAVTGEAQQAFLDYCSHKRIPLGPKVALTRKGQIRCPHHDVCFDCTSGAVTDDKGKKMPHGLVPVVIETTGESAGGTNDNVTLRITPEHEAYLSQHFNQLQKRDKSRKNSTTRRKEQNHAGDTNQNND